MFGAIARWIRNALTTLRNPAGWFLDALGYSDSESGVRISGYSILSYAPLWYAINRISGHVGILPMRLCQLLGDGDVRIAEPYEFPEIGLINRAPNEFMTGVDFRETLQSHAIIHGNGRAGIVRNGLGQAIELLPLQPESTQTYLVYVEGKVVEKWHYTTTADGRYIPIPDHDVLHVKGLASDGLVGYSLVSVARESVGGALAAEKYVNRTYRNGGMPSIILEAPANAFRNDEHAEDYLRKFHANHGGLDNVNKPGLLRYGVTARQISQSNHDAQFLENRRFSREEAALWTAIESMLGVEKAESYNSLAQRNEAYKQNCLARWLRKWEQECDAKLLSQRQRQAGYFWKFDTYGLLSGSIRERYETLQIGRQMGLISQEESRRMENLGRPNAGENYANPNTTPGAGTSSASSAAGDEAQTEDVASRVRGAVVAQLAHERTHVSEMAHNHHGFLARVEMYYRRFADRITLRLVDAGVPAELVDTWIKQSQEEILETTGQAQPAELPAAIETLMQSWSARRVDEFVSEALEVIENAKRDICLR